MSKEKVLSLTKYVEGLKNRLQTGIIPDRRKDQAAAYKAFLDTEIKRTQRRIDYLTGAYVGGKK